MLIALEGIDGSGKTTQAKLLADRLTVCKVKTHVLGFPDRKTPTGLLLSSMLQGNRSVGDTHLDALIVQALMTVNRLEHSDMLVEYALNPDAVLILDRYWGSALAYGKADGLDARWLRGIHQLLPQAVLWFLLDIEVDESFRRRPVRRDIYETNHEFLNRVRVAYQDSAERGVPLPAWVKLDGQKTIDEVHNNIWQRFRQDLLTKHLFE